MSLFTYTAVRRNGEKVNGELAAESRAEAFRKLDREQLQPISLVAKNGASAEASVAKPVISFAPGSLLLTRAQIILFTEEMSDMLEAGLQLEQALRVMEERQELSSLKDVTSSLRQQVREGVSFSSALRSVSKSFDELYCNLVAAGEMSGALPQILRRQASYLSTMDELQNRVFQALIYPAFLVAAGIVLLFIFMTVLVPKLMTLLNKTGKNVPLPTKILITTSNFFQHYWWAILVVVIAGSLLFWQLLQRPEGRRWWDEIRLKIPMLGPVMTARFYAQFAHTLATLVSNGITLLTGLRLMNNANSNVFLKALITQATLIVEEGGSLSRALKRVGHFPSLFIDMVSVGEQTGDLGAALTKVAKRYDKEVSKRITLLTSLIQPTIIAVMALLVGIVAYSMITGINQSIGGLRR